MSSPLPYFKFWQKEWLSSSTTRMLSFAARGVYIDLLAFQWEDGYLPASEQKLRKLVGASQEEFAPIWEELKDEFVPVDGDPSKIIHPRLAKDREESIKKVTKNQEIGQKLTKRQRRWARLRAAGGEISRVVRQRVFVRARYTCSSCGSAEDLTIDHIIPISRGGTNCDSNLDCLCRPCNSRKKDRVMGAA